MKQLGILRHAILVAGLVKNDVYIRERALQRGAVAHITLHELDTAMDIRGASSRMDARLQIIQDSHLIPALE